MLKPKQMPRITWPRLNFNNIFRHRRTKINRLKNHLGNLLKKKFIRSRSSSKKHQGVAVAGEVVDEAVVVAGVEDVVKIINNNRLKKKLITTEILRSHVAATVEITITTINATIIAREIKVLNHIIKRIWISKMQLFPIMNTMIMKMEAQNKQIMMLRSPKLKQLRTALPRTISLKSLSRSQ